VKTISKWLSLALVIIFLAGCGGGAPSKTNTPPKLPTAAVTTVPAPSTDAALSGFLNALQGGDYGAMYKLLSKTSQQAISITDFTAKYTSALDEMGVSKIKYSISSSLTNPQSAQVAYHLVYETALFGNIERDFNAGLALEEGEWRLNWDDSLILPELAGGKLLKTSYVPPARGDIYDINGNAIATTTDVYALGLISGEVSPENLDAVINTLARITGADRLEIRNNYDNYNDGDYVPVGEASVDVVRRTGIDQFSGVSVQGPYTTRFYTPNTAPNVTGYVTSVFREEVEAYKRLGYGPNDTVGRLGIEKWGQPYLGGRDAATLSIYSADGTTKLSDLAQVNATPASSITLTIDSDFQQQVQAAMDGLPGAAVVMEVNTGRVLAMVSSPGFDVNWFDGNNPNRSIAPMPDTLNRAAQSKYPLGSVFKIISMAAALESGAFTKDDTLDCQYHYDVAGTVLDDWTWMDCQDEKQNTGKDTCPSWPPSGVLTLPEGLMRSCDPWFYHIGYTLWQQGQAGTIKNNFLSDMARAFGLGQATGIQQIAEDPGNIPDPTDGLDATSIAIGQGRVQVTPLQVARYVAAVANGGTLYRPQLVEKIQPTSGDPISAFKPEASGTLPVTKDNLKLIQDAMREVAVNKRGTAYYTLGNFGIPTAAKTGTAETGAEPNAWFAGYSMAGKADKPDIAVAVIVQDQQNGEGAIWAAPIFRRIMEIYFYGHPQTVYRWESSLGVRNPDYGQPVPTETPEPQ
jgi:penicillin-binding protein 2